MKAINIEWDVTDGTEDMTQEEMNEILETLPREVELPRDIEEDEIADYLSDEYGFCIFGLDVSYDDTDKVLACIKEINSNLAKITDFLPEIVDEEGNSTDLILDGFEYDTESDSVRIRVWSHSK